MKKLPQFIIMLFEKEYTAKYDYDNNELILENEKELHNVDIIRIRDLNNYIINSKSGLHFWYIENCVHVNSDYVLFKVKYFGSDPLNIGNPSKRKYNKIILSGSKTVNRLLHPADYFFLNQNESNINILNEKKTMKTFSVNYQDMQLLIKIYIGDLISRGNISKFDDYLKIEIEIDNEIEIKETFALIKKVKQAFMILSGNENVIFKYIELYKDDSYIYITENGEDVFQKLLSVNLYQAEILEKVIKGTIENKELEFRFFEKNNIEIKTLYICRAFEKIVKKRNVKIKRTEKEDIVIDKLLKILHEEDSNGFTRGLDNSLKTYNNKFYSHLKWAFAKYYNYLDDENMSWPDLFIKKVGKKVGDEVSFDDSATRINELRNNIAHDDITNLILAKDKGIINGLEYITYIMLLEEFKLTKNEILLFMTWGMNLFIE